MKATQHVQWGSIPVSMDTLSFLNRLFITLSFAGLLVLGFPHLTLAQTVPSTPMLFTIDPGLFNRTPGNDMVPTTFAEIISPATPAALDPRVELLRQYLDSKKSKMAGEAEVLLRQYHYRLILGIAFAESNFCKYQIRPNNCWGIGGSRPETYPTLADGIVRANQLIQKYQDLGMTTPKLMRNSWVGWQNDNWIVAVEQITRELEQTGL